jgi:hypothetical protein
MNKDHLRANFVPGTSGLELDFTTGDAEFNNVTVRGSGSSIGDGAVLEDLTVNGTLLMGSGGEITNVGGNFRVNASGFAVIGPTAANSFPTQSQSFSMFSGTDLVGFLGAGTIGTAKCITLRSTNNTFGLSLIAPTGNKIEMLPLSAGGDGGGNIKVHLTDTNTATGKLVFAGVRDMSSGISELPIGALIVDSSGFLRLKLS